MVKKLSEHFTLLELCNSDTADRLGIDNAPSKTATVNLIRLCREVLEPLREAIGPITVLSGYRSLKLNSAVGSKPTSHHVAGRAADIRVNGIAALDVCRKVVEMNLPFDELIAEYASADGGGWCHVAVASDKANPRRRILSIDKIGTRMGVLLEARA